ncbi:MAG: hypothetical protein WC969_15280 [Elusimicrobiota bacterium]|jgi:hypothetical protein
MPIDSERRHTMKMEELAARERIERRRGYFAIAALLVVSALVLTVTGHGGAVWEVTKTAGLVIGGVVYVRFIAV